jgi:hypothetical protein
LAVFATIVVVVEPRESTFPWPKTSSKSETAIVALPGATPTEAEQTSVQLTIVGAPATPPPDVTVTAIEAVVVAT